MKKIIFAVILGFGLSACGGGGGAAPSVIPSPSDLPPPSTTPTLTPEQREVLQREANDLRAEVDALGSSNQAEKDLLLREIDSLLEKINAQSETIDNLRNEIATLQDRVVKVAVSPPVEISPPPTCNGANEEANGENCVCVADYSRKNGVCEKDVPPPPTCNGANEEANGRNCECVAGYERQNGVCELPQPNCGEDEYLSNGVCKPLCAGANEVPDDGACVCAPGYDTRYDGNGVCESLCGGANEKNNGDGTCSCVAGYERRYGACELSSTARCTNFRVRDAQGECGYDTPEFRGNHALESIGALTAYNSDVNDGYGAHGQGVTLALIDTGEPRLDHESLEGQIVNSLFADRTHSTDGYEDYHATATGGLIVAKRKHNGKGMHGVAPESKLVSFFSGGAYGKLLQYLVDNDFPIASNQTANPCILRGQFRGKRYYTGRCPSAINGVRSSLINHYKPVEGSDIVFVQAHGNNGWQGLNSTIFLGLCGNQDIDKKCELPSVNDREIITLNVGEFINEFNDENMGELSTLGISPFLGDVESYVPLENPLLEDNRIAVVAVDRQSVIADFSDACGDVKRWCISAPGTDIVAPHSYTTDEYTSDPYAYIYQPLEGTSFSAPIVSGALAVLQSAAPYLPMTVVRRILLTTATDLGAEGIDEIYGWGLVNISAGIVSIEALETEGMNGKNGILLADLRESLPGEFAHLRGRLESVSVALRITDRSFYNIPLSDIVGGGESAAANIGGAAKEMQADSYKAGESFRFWGGLNYDGGKSNYIGEGGGIFSAASAEDIGGYMRWTTANYGGISAFGEYGRTEINADYGGNALIAAVDNARAEEWTMGIQYRDLWRKDDNIILSARQESRISGGNMILRYPVADGDSHKAFIGETPQTIRTETARIPIKQKPQTIWTLGYSQQTDSGKWSAATEWNTAKNESAFSFAVELQIR